MRTKAIQIRSDNRSKLRTKREVASGHQLQRGCSVFSLSKQPLNSLTACRAVFALFHKGMYPDKMIDPMTSGTTCCASSLSYRRMDKPVPVTTPPKAKTYAEPYCFRAFLKRAEASGQPHSWAIFAGFALNSR